MPEAPTALLELEAAYAEAADTWAGALLRPSSDPESDVRAMSDDGLVRVTEALARLGRRVEALQARCAAGVAERSRGGVDEDDLARKHWYGSAERLVAVGQATSRRASFTGEALPSRHPHLAAALDGGALCVDAAEVIRRFLDGRAQGVAHDELEAAEQLLVDRAPVVGIDGLARLIKQLEAHLDPDGVKPPRRRAARTTISGRLGGRCRRDQPPWGIRPRQRRAHQARDRGARRVRAPPCPRCEAAARRAGARR